MYVSFVVLELGYQIVVQLLENDKKETAFIYELYQDLRNKFHYLRMENINCVKVNTKLIEENAKLQIKIENYKQIYDHWIQKIESFKGEIASMI